jgi:enamine deaminase RidA (YjgF/YER057c/UK114 family)
MRVPGQHEAWHGEEADAAIGGGSLWRDRGDTAAQARPVCLGERPMPIEHLHPGKRLSDATIYNGVIYLAGQVPENTDAAIREQTRNVLDQIDRLLAAAGSDRKRLLTATIYLAQMADYAAMNEVWDEWIAAAPQGPARATVEAQLANPQWRIEIQITAAARD